MSLALPQSKLDAIADACRRHQVLRMHLFGSALRDDFDPARSDLDLLVEFQPIEPGALCRLTSAWSSNWPRSPASRWIWWWSMPCETRRCAATSRLQNS